MRMNAYVAETNHASGRPGRAGRGGLRLSAAALLMTVLVGAMVGCGASQPYVTPARLDRGLVIVLPGIEGRSRFNEDICRGLDAAGVDWAIELHDWTSWLGPLYNLRAEVENRQKAREVGWRIARYHWDYPDRPVVLVGQSGGAAIAIWTAEGLMRGHKVEGLILLAASISPGYPLEFALANTRRGIVNLHSSRDLLLLGVGTTVAGTMDGRHSASAGQAGFRQPPSELREELGYDRLYPVPWRPEMGQAGNPGLHITSGAMGFVAEFVAPLVLAPQWSHQVVYDVTHPVGPDTPEPWSETRPVFEPSIGQ